MAGYKRKRALEIAHQEVRTTPCSFSSKEPALVKIEIGRAHV